MCVYANVLNCGEADRLIDAYGGQERYDRLARVNSQYARTTSSARTSLPSHLPPGGAQ